MLTTADKPTIRNAIFKRLGKEPGVQIADIAFKDDGDHLKVGILLIDEHNIQTHGLLDFRARFDLPSEFEHSHLLNEIDEIAEQVKEGRRKVGLSLLLPASTHRAELSGTGLRGRWPA